MRISTIDAGGDAREQGTCARGLGQPTGSHVTASSEVYGFGLVPPEQVVRVRCIEAICVNPLPGGDVQRAAVLRGAVGKLSGGMC